MLVLSAKAPCKMGLKGDSKVGMEKWLEKASKIKNQRVDQENRKIRAQKLIEDKLDEFVKGPEHTAAIELLTETHNPLTLRIGNGFINDGNNRFYHGFEEFSQVPSKTMMGWNPLKTSIVAETLVRRFRDFYNSYPNEEQAVDLCNDLLNNLRSDLDKIADQA